MKNLFVFTAVLFLAVSSLVQAEALDLKLEFWGNPDGHGKTMVAQARIYNSQGVLITTGRPDCLPKQGCDTAYEPKQGDGVVSGVIYTSVFQGSDSYTIPLPLAGEAINVVVDLQAANGSVKHVELKGKAILGQFSEFYKLTSPAGDGPANVGFSAWLKKR